MMLCAQMVVNYLTATQLKLIEYLLNVTSAALVSKMNPPLTIVYLDIIDETLSNKPIDLLHNELASLRSYNSIIDDVVNVELTKNEDIVHLSSIVSSHRGMSFVKT